MAKRPTKAHPGERKIALLVFGEIGLFMVADSFWVPNFGTHFTIGHAILANLVALAIRALWRMRRPLLASLRWSLRQLAPRPEALTGDEMQAAIDCLNRPVDSVRYGKRPLKHPARAIYRRADQGKLWSDLDDDISDL
jgi:hypothetical protein